MRPSAHVSAAIRLPTALLLPEAHVSLEGCSGWWLRVAQATGQLDAVTRHKASRPVHVKHPCALKQTVQLLNRLTPQQWPLGYSRATMLVREFGLTELQGKSKMDW